MKKLFSLVLITILFSAVARADNGTNAPVKPYPFDWCLICGMSVKGPDAYTFVYQGQEIKLCEKSEKASFDRNPDKYMKKIADAAKINNSVSH
jgi:YHS domain-containing protein